MRKKIATALSVLLVVCLMGSMTAYAATTNDNNIVTTVTYTKTESPSDTGEPNLPLYEIAIPSQMSINEGNLLPIYLIENNLSGTQTLRVMVDADMTIEDDGFLHLAGTQNQSPAKVSVGYYNTAGNTYKIGSSGVYEVATFKSGNNHPASNGTMFFDIIDEDALIADTYTGRVYFTLRVTTE